MTVTKRRKRIVPESLNFIFPLVTFLNADLHSCTRNELSTYLWTAAQETIKTTRPSSKSSERTPSKESPAPSVSKLSFELSEEYLGIVNLDERQSLERIASNRQQSDPDNSNEHYARHMAIALQDKVRNVLLAISTRTEREGRGPLTGQTVSDGPSPIQLAPLLSVLRTMIYRPPENPDSLPEWWSNFQVHYDRKSHCLSWKILSDGIDTKIWFHVFIFLCDRQWSDYFGVCKIRECQHRFFIKQRSQQKFCSLRHQDLWAKREMRKKI